MPAVGQLTLEPLSPAGVGQLLAAAGSRLDAVAVHRSTGGNPFFVTELVAVADDGLPATVRDAVLARAGRLTAPARRTLSAAAVLGQRAELPLLLAVAGEGGAGVDECVQRGMLVADGDRLSFRHELARLAVEDAIAPNERRDLHARALRHGREAGALDDRRVAHHAAAAGDVAAVREHAPAAAARAARLGAHREAVQLYRLALAFSDDPVTSARLHAALAYECYLTDRTAEAHAERRAALAIWEQLDDRAEIGDTRRWLSRLSWFLGRNEEADEHGSIAVQVLESLGASPQLAMAYSNVAQLHMLSDHVDATVDWGTRAIELARDVGDRDAEIHALNNVGTVLWSAEGRPEGRTQLVRSLELALAADAHEHAARAYTNLGGAAVLNRLYAEGDAHLRAGVAYCEDRDLDSWRLYMTAWLARSCAEQGRFDEAETHVEEVLRQPQLSAVARIPAQVVRAQLLARRGADAGPLIDEVTDLALGTGEQQRLVPVAVAAAEAAWIAGRRAADVLAAVDLGWGVAVAQPRRWVLGEIAWWSVLGGRPVDPALDLAEPSALMVAGRFAEAARAWQEIGSPPWRSVTLGLADDPDDAREGLALADELRVPALRAALVRERHARGLTVPRGPRASTSANALGLTTRELDVLDLVADGLTNAEVAQRLFLSEKTVGHHVSALLRKTGETTRARAVAAARRAGLLHPT